MRKLCLVTTGVLAMTFLIASISLLVARVLQKVVDLQVKQDDNGSLCVFKAVVANKELLLFGILSDHFCLSFFLYFIGLVGIYGFCEGTATQMIKPVMANLGTPGVFGLQVHTPADQDFWELKFKNSWSAKDAVLKNGTTVFKMWEEPSPPVYMQFYFFNLTNPLEVLEGELPLVRQIGPYTYREHRPRVDVHIIDNDTEVSSLNPKTYFFEREMSVGDPEIDLIRTVNVPAVYAMDLASETPLHLPAEILLFLYNEDMFTTHSVHELLWGYTDKFLNALHKFRPNIDSEFGFFKKMNGSDDGEYIMLSGTENYLDFTRIIQWRGNKSLNWWTSPTSNMINGTDGTTFHPLVDKDETIYVFSSDFCRSLYLNFEKNVMVQGIPAYRFVPPKRFYANASVNPDNAGFCVPVGNCPGTGLLNISGCREGAPIFLSPPHFYQSDEKYVMDIDGMHPNKEEHETFLDINPLTGMLVQAAKRIQINVYVKKLPDFVQTGNIRTLFFPVMFINESVVVDKESAQELKKVLMESSVITNIPFVIMVLGIIFGVAFVVLACKPLRARDEERTVDILDMYGLDCKEHRLRLGMHDEMTEF